MGRTRLLHQLTLFTLPLVYLLLARVLFDFNGLYGQDAHRYFQFIDELDTYFRTGQPTDPFFWPVLYPLTGLTITRFTGIDGILALQLISAISLSVTGVLLYRLLEKVSLNRAFAYVLIGLILCPTLIIRSVVDMSDIFCMMWIMVCWYSWFRWAENRGLFLLPVMALAGAFAVTSRYAAVLLVIVPIAHSTLKVLVVKPWQAVVIILVFFLGLSPEWIIEATQSNISGNYLLGNWSFLHLFQSNFTTIDGVQNNRFVNLIYLSYPFWHPAYLIVGLPVLIYVMAKKIPLNANWIILSGIGIYLLFIGGLPMQSRRFFVIVFPLILLAIFQSGLTDAFKKLSGGLKWSVVVLLIILQIAITYYYGRTYVEMNRFEKKLAMDLHGFEGSNLYLFYWDTALKTYNLDFKYHNLQKGEISSFETGGLVLFNEPELEQQWEGQQLMLNWQRLESGYELIILKEWDNGWRLYEIQ